MLDHQQLDSPQLVLTPDGTSVTVKDESPTVSVLWDVVTQAAIVEARTGPTVGSRAQALVHTAIYDAWAAYDPDAISTQLADDLQRPLTDNTDANKREAASFAAYRVLEELFPEQLEQFNELMGELGYDPGDRIADASSAAGIGNLAAEALLAYRRQDGSNQLNAYADTTGYEPDNSASRRNAIDRWTPETVPIDAVSEAEIDAIQEFLTPHWGEVSPFALADGNEFRPPAPQSFFTEDYASSILNLDEQSITLPDGMTVDVTPDLVGEIINPGFIAQAQDVINASANLTDEQKLIAEFWETGAGTSFPPGTWMTFGQFVSARDNHDLDTDVQLFFALSNAVFDAGIGTWESKTHYDYVRPVRAIRDLGSLGLIGEEGTDEITGEQGTVIEAWGGPGLGTQTILAERFLTYQTPGSDPSPPFAEYTSGHSAFSAAAAEVLAAFTGSDDFGAAVTIQPGASRFEPATTPSEPVTLSWDTFSEASDEAGISRIYGGIHFDEGDLNGRLLGREIGEKVYEQAQFFIHGGRLLPKTIDFDETGLSAGTVVTDRFTGMTISGNGLVPLIFDTANPTQAEADMASDTLGNVLILAKNADAAPDSYWKGGTFQFEFDELVQVESLQLLDIEEMGGAISLYGSQGNAIASFDIAVTPDGAVGAVDVGIGGVKRMDVTLAGSGAISEINFA